MPKSLRCKIKKLCYNGALTERERDRILKALDQENVLDKIRAEIEETYINITYQENKERKERKASWGLRKTLDIIDKYKTESEE